VANITSQIKRNRQNRRREDGNKAVRSRLKTEAKKVHSAAATGDAALVDLLIARGADPHTAADDGRTPADFADERGHPALAERLRG
jgi:ankyrin repeat protein